LGVCLSTLVVSGATPLDLPDLGLAFLPDLGLGVKARRAAAPLVDLPLITRTRVLFNACERCFLMALWARSGTERCDVLSRLLCAESPTPSFLGDCLEPARTLVCAGRGLVKEAPPVKEAPFARTVVAPAAFLCDAPAALLLQDIDSACSWCARKGTPETRG
jgi:hypothetical protein